ncbi:KilA-N domain-containing protein [Pasteurella multocida]|uniref:KilA-N domain-containing protein n=1 Tax=Pasteurella multocida TaxID=747 RepID=UPI0039EF1726
MGKYEVQPQQLALPEPEKKYIDNRNKPQYTGILSKNTKRLPHPSDLAVFLCQFNGGTIAGKYNTLMGIPSSGFLCIPESESRHPQTNVANLSKNTKELAMANIITAHYNGTEVFFQDDAYLNATAIAKHFNKRPNDWLALPTTQEYIETLCKKTETRKSGNATEVGKSHFVKTVKGGKDLSRQGTWLHRRLAVAFARWLNVEFAIWCDEQIEKILINKNKPQQLALPEPDLNLTAIQNSEETLALIIQLYSYCFQAHEMQEKLQNTNIAKLMESQIGGQYLYNFKHPLEQVMAKAKKYVHSNTERLALVKAVNNLLN